MTSLQAKAIQLANALKEQESQDPKSFINRSSAENIRPLENQRPDDDVQARLRKNGVSLEEIPQFVDPLKWQAYFSTMGKVCFGFVLYLWSSFPIG